MSEKTDTTKNKKVVEKVEFKFNDKIYKLGLNDKKEVVNLFTVERNFLFYPSIFLTIVAIIAFIYDFFMDIGDNVKGFGIMWKGDYGKGYAKSQGYTKKNIIRTVGKYVLLIISSTMFAFSQRDVLVDNLTTIKLFSNKDFVDITERTYLDHISKKNGSNKNKNIENFENSIFYKLKKHNKLV